MSKNPFITRNRSSSSRNENPFLSSNHANHANHGGGNMFLPHLHHEDTATAANSANSANSANISFEEAFPVLGGKAANDKDKDKPVALNFKSAVQKNAPAQQQQQQQQQPQSQQSQQSKQSLSGLDPRLRTNMFLCPQRMRYNHDAYDAYDDAHYEPDEHYESCEGAYDSAYTKYYND
jgi:hypothetical protein